MHRFSKKPTYILSGNSTVALAGKANTRVGVFYLNYAIKVNYWHPLWHNRGLILHKCFLSEKQRKQQKSKLHFSHFWLVHWREKTLVKRNFHHLGLKYLTRMKWVQLLRHWILWNQQYSSRAVHNKLFNKMWNVRMKGDLWEGQRSLADLINYRILKCLFTEVSSYKRSDVN